MSKTKRERYEANRRQLREMNEDGDISDDDLDCIFEFLDAKDPECGVVDDPTDSPKADGTLAQYAYVLKRILDLADFNLTDTTARECNYLMDDVRNGRVDGVKDGGLTKGSVRNYQKTVRKFYEYQDDLGVDNAEIVIFNTEDTSVDERDIFADEDITAIREAAEHPRDAALVDFLLYTGQRLSATLNLRVKDVRPSEGIFYLNTEMGDLKGADGKRPLLYAEKAARTWLNQHPCKDDPEAHFITQKVAGVGSHDYDVGDRLDNSTVYAIMDSIKERSGVEKPMNPHNFRHTFVTICKKKYDMDNDTIKRLIGHDMDSTVMERTYSHLTDDDVIDAAERATGIAEDEPNSPLTPDICENCGEPVHRDDAKACDACGIVFTPDAHEAKERVQDDMWNSAGDVAGQSAEGLDDLRTLAKEQPTEFIQAVLAAMDDDEDDEDDGRGSSVINV